ncbi:sulfate/molybdate ABC transporter ATP-binding protein [Actinomycetospora termitidis]|uniref:ATP-binding cassette domain-containing protein n=1 Tax=Actinomycetospora termitidis TaxID=3053470 RepID=A0ABT7MAM0_9PSEU|nr:ATP-binding cassette domain-containing protein [Actinomycetospora sp. Odt1-22]MDL5157481.1 ATP-binding cassette domain-containing protein [Actinomycetospora sp. Odt1-22]
MSRLEVDVAVTRGSFTLDVSVTVGSGEVVAVLGSNGAGKSTFLGALAGLHAPDRGAITLDGRELGGVPVHRRRVGLLSQQALLFPHLTARDNVAFGPRSSGAGRRAARETADRWLAMVDATALADRRPAELSGGQAQRIAIARALACEPELLLLDEPFAALDVDVTPAVRSLLRRVVRATGVTTLMVTHDVLDAVVLADRLVVLDAGRVVESGPTAEVLRRPRSAFAARIAGLDLVPGRSCPEGLRTTDGTVVGGMHPETLDDGEAAVALFAPAAVSVFREPPKGSPRTTVPVRLAAMEPHGELVRLRAGVPDGGPGWVEGLAADVTPAAVAQLGVEPGDEVWFAVKAAEVEVHPAGR